MPGEGTRVFRITPCCASVMKSVLRSGPPYAASVVLMPAQDLMRRSGSPSRLNIHAVPNPGMDVGEKETPSAVSDGEGAFLRVRGPPGAVKRLHEQFGRSAMNK